MQQKGHQPIDVHLKGRGHGKKSIFWAKKRFFSPNVFEIEIKLFLFHVVRLIEDN